MWTLATGEEVVDEEAGDFMFNLSLSHDDNEEEEDDDDEDEP